MISVYYLGKKENKNKNKTYYVSDQAKLLISQYIINLEWYRTVHKECFVLRGLKDSCDSQNLHMPTYCLLKVK